MFPLATVNLSMPDETCFVRARRIEFPIKRETRSMLTYTYGKVSALSGDAAPLQDLFKRANSVMDRVSLRSIGTYFYF